MSAGFDDVLTVSVPGTMAMVTSSLQVTGLTVISGTSSNGVVQTDVEGQINVGNGAPVNGNDVPFLLEKKVQLMVGTPTAVSALLILALALFAFRRTKIA